MKWIFMVSKIGHSMLTTKWEKIKWWIKDSKSFKPKWFSEEFCLEGTENTVILKITIKFHFPSKFFNNIK